MSVKRDKPVFVARLQKKITFTRVTRAIEASVRVLGYGKMRQEQFDVILNFLKGNDVFVSLPTGGGKSLCYASLPFVYDRLREETSRSIALVISPLNALMQDQVASFTKRGMTAVHVGSDCSPSLVDKIISGEMQLVYMSPEAILTVPTWREMFRNHCYQDNLICVAVDEAHLVEKWCVCVCAHVCVMRSCL
jgi:superfamily II DNA helicase RecQ